MSDYKLGLSDKIRVRFFQLFKHSRKDCILFDKFLLEAIKLKMRVNDLDRVRKRIFGRQYYKHLKEKDEERYNSHLEKKRIESLK